jgi:hypothetical protein
LARTIAEPTSTAWNSVSCRAALAAAPMGRTQERNRSRETLRLPPQLHQHVQIPR